MPRAYEVRSLKFEAALHFVPCVSAADRSEEHTSELQSQSNLVCRLLLEKKKHVVIDETRYLTFSKLDFSVLACPHQTLDQPERPSLSTPRALEFDGMLLHVPSTPHVSIA